MLRFNYLILNDLNQFNSRYKYLFKIKEMSMKKSVETQ